MTKFIKINKSLINVDRIISTAVNERINKYNSKPYWLISMTLSDGSVVQAATADTLEGIERLNSELYEELKRLTA
ncbi:hypothetical phage protein [Psychrobacter phage Psymv2]|uniref:hypothetical protein n=1 Tax=Psychrobacter phage Psymv2 TaxID=1071177 RepID=UPI00022A37F5|nr:hypothetical protein CJ96_gp47 [Psychrobacter phage Psymv2]AEO01003.1 hypothetical phage protein [Psychrobacter phage Psymv2]